MDSSNVRPSEKKDEHRSLGSSAENLSQRKKTDSESSDRQTKFVLPSADGTPPKILTMDEVVDVVKNIQNMTLAHEIALNPEFKLQSYEPPENSLEKRIKDVMHKAFWDVLREQLDQKPPCYEHAMQLLVDIKECFPQIMSVNNHRILEHINQVLDIAVIRQQAENNTLDFKSYAKFITDMMGRSCAPVRDEQIAALSTIDNVVDLFKGILEAMSVMKLDMANCLLDFARNDLLANSVEYEKQKFKEYLEYYKFGFPATDSWLKRNETRDINGKKSSTEQTIFNAYMELMDWDDAVEFPEILSMDEQRIRNLSNRALKLCVSASVTAISSAIPIVANNTDCRNLIASQVHILLETIKGKSDISDLIENIWLQILAVIKARLEKDNQDALDQSTEASLKTQILKVAESDSPVYKLMWKRLEIFVRLILKPGSGLPQPPPGYLEFKDEIESFAVAFKRIITYNYSVFGEYYTHILTIGTINNDEQIA